MATNAALGTRVSIGHSAAAEVGEARDAVQVTPQGTMPMQSG